MFTLIEISYDAPKKKSLVGTLIFEGDLSKARQRAPLSQPLTLRKSSQEANTLRAGRVRRGEVKLLGFQYAPSWLNDARFGNGAFALGNDLPLKSGLIKPDLGTFAFLEASLPSFLSPTPLLPEKLLLKRLIRRLDLEKDPAIGQFAWGALHFESVTDTSDSALNRENVKAFLTEALHLKTHYYPGPLRSWLYHQHLFEREKGTDETFNLLNELGWVPKDNTALMLSGEKSLVISARQREDAFDKPLWQELGFRLANLLGIKTIEHETVNVLGENVSVLGRSDQCEKSDRKGFFLPALALKEFKVHPRRLSYLDIADILSAQGARASEDLQAAWSRMVFFSLLGGADDHPARWQFYRDELGWRLAPLDEVYPSHETYGVQEPMTIDHKRTLSYPELFLEYAPYFRLSRPEAKKRLLEMRHKLKQWESIARDVGLNAGDIKALQAIFN